MSTKNHKSEWISVGAFFLVGVIVGLSVLVVIDSDQTGMTRLERVDSLSGGPFVVERDTSAGPRYLGEMDESLNLVPSFGSQWGSLDDARRYAEFDDAHRAATMFHARSVALREVTP